MKSALQRGSSLHQRAQHGAKPVPSYCRGSAGAHGKRRVEAGPMEVFWWTSALRPSE